ncbi:MAG TPA: CocE/NonD family hydrolase [Thermoanaerobaculaceae bacterium]|nr:CocE/NonD family hydrolase [Thermoanaerobaculaceae bacterium]
MPNRLARGLVTLLTALTLPAVAAAQTLRDVMVAAPDGTPLATDVYFPFLAGSGPWPVILQRTPYGKGSSTVQDACYLFNLWGYACVGQDERGRGGSGGHYTGYLEEGGDGRATVEWIARQVWCDGNVGTFGGSALGMTQYSMAPGAPPALKCMVPVVATPDFYHDAVYQGGALRYALAHGWLADQGALDVYGELLAHRLWDAWWASWAVLPEVATVNVAALHVGGWYDIFTQGSLDAFSRFQHDGGPGAVGAQKLVIGPWTHYGTFQATAGQLDYPSNAFYVDDFPSLVESWMDAWLKGDGAAVAAWPPVRVYLMGAVGEAGAPGNVWLDLPDWPPRATVGTLYPSADRSLVASPPAAGEVAMLADPAAPVPTLGGQELSDVAGPYDQRPIEGRSDVVAFTTPPLPAPLAVVGRVWFRAWVRPDTPDLDLAVRLTDVYPDGRSMLVTDGVQRARKRCGDTVECFLTPGVPTELDVDVGSTAIAFNAGHRIRVVISGSNAPRFEVNPNDGGDLDQPSAGVVAHPALLLDRDHPSRVELPVFGGLPHARRHLASR